MCSHPSSRLRGGGPCDVLGIGAVAVDDLLYVDGYPGPDTKVRIADERREGGGLVATALVAAARLGARTAYLGVLGHDELSSFALAGLEGAGVDCCRVVRRPGCRPIHSRILVDRQSGQRTILFSMAGVTSLTTGEVDAALLTSCRVLLVDGTVAPVACHAARLARDAGIPVVADLEDPHGVAVPDLVGLVDHLIVGSRYASAVTGERGAAATERLWRAGMAACVVTAGEQGSWYLAPETGGVVAHEPATRVRALDTNGCGDVFHGAYAARIATGDSVAGAVRVASRMAALKAARGAGWPAIPAGVDVIGAEGA